MRSLVCRVVAAHLRLKRSLGGTKMEGTSRPRLSESLIVSGGMPNWMLPCLVCTYTPPRGRWVTFSGVPASREPPRLARLRHLRGVPTVRGAPAWREGAEARRRGAN